MSNAEFIEDDFDSSSEKWVHHTYRRRRCCVSFRLVAKQVSTNNLTMSSKSRKSGKTVIHMLAKSVGNRTRASELQLDDPDSGSF